MLGGRLGSDKYLKKGQLSPNQASGVGCEHRLEAKLPSVRSSACIRFAPSWFLLETSELINLLTQKPEISLDRDSSGCDFSVVERWEGFENVVGRYGVIDQGRQLAQMRSGIRCTPERPVISPRKLSFSQNMPALFQCAISSRRLSRFRPDLTLKTRPRAETPPKTSMAKALDTVPGASLRDRGRARQRLTSRCTLGRFVRIPSSGQKNAIYPKCIRGSGASASQY